MEENTREPSPHELEVLVLEALQKITRGKTSTMLRMTQDFLSLTPKLLDEIKNNLKEKDHVNALRRAHSLKGGSQYACSPRIEQYALHLEQVIKRNDLSGIQKTLRDIEYSLKEYEIACKKIKGLDS